MAVKKYIKIWLLFFRNSFKKEFSDLKNILASHLAVVFWMLSVVFFYKVILDQVGDIAGWETGEILILIGTYFTIDGLIYTFFYWNCIKLESSIKKRELDSVLVKPVNSQFMMSLQEIQASMYIQFITTIIFIIIGISKLNASLTIQSIVIYILLVICGALIAYSVWFIFVCLIFWISSITNVIHFFEEIFTFAQYPDSIFSSGLKIVLTYILPLIVMTTFPVKALINTIEPSEIILTLGLTVTFFTLARLVWKKGLQRYTSN